MKDTKRIFSKGKAMDLIKMGNVLLRVDIDKYDTSKLVYIFEDNLKLRDDMTNLNKE